MTGPTGFKAWVPALVLLSSCTFSTHARQQAFSASTSSGRSERSLIADEMGAWEVKESLPGEEEEYFKRSLCETSLNGNWSKLAVIAGTKYSPTWLKALGIDYIIYQSESKSLPFYYYNHANEAGAYLQFSVDFFDCLPEYVVFLHGHMDSWHSKNMSETLRTLKWEAVPGYADLNRFDPRQMPMAARPRYPPVDTIAEGEDAYKGGYATHQIIDGKAYPWWESHLHLLQNSYARAYDQFWGPQGFGAMPDMIQHVAGAQHVVTRDAMRSRPRIFYMEALRYMLPKNNDLRANHVHGRAYVVGDMYSLMWHMVYGQPAVYQPLPACDLFRDC